MPSFDLDIDQTAYFFVRLQGDGAAKRARKMAEIMRSKGDNEGADTWLRVMVAIDELGNGSAKQLPNAQRHS
jgi:hypothetical protein